MEGLFTMGNGTELPSGTACQGADFVLDTKL
jgi:hypothetical protein